MPHRLDPWLNVRTSITSFNAAYVDFKREGGIDYWMCLLCNSSWLNMRERKVHFHGQSGRGTKKHQKNYAVLQSYQAEYDEAQVLVRVIKQDCTPLALRARMLPSKAWRDDVVALLFVHVSGNPSNATFLAQVKRRLERYEKMERLSLLEMAIWKWNMLGCDVASFESMQEMREYPALDEEFDVDAFKANRRKTCMAVRIIPFVSDFI